MSDNWDYYLPYVPLTQTKSTREQVEINEPGGYIIVDSAFFDFAERPITVINCTCSLLITSCNFDDCTTQSEIGGGSIYFGCLDHQSNFIITKSCGYGGLSCKGNSFFVTYVPTNCKNEMQLLSLTNFIHPEYNAIITMFGGSQKAHNLNVSNNEVKRHSGFSLCSSVSTVSYCTMSNNIAHDGIILYFTLNQHVVDHCIVKSNYQEVGTEDGILVADNLATVSISSSSFVGNSGGYYLFRAKNSAINVLNTYVGYNFNLDTSMALFINQIDEFDFVNVHFVSGNCLANVPYSEEIACTELIESRKHHVIFLSFFFIKFTGC